MTKEDLAIKLYRTGYNDAANRSQPMTDEEILQLIRLLEKTNG